MTLRVNCFAFEFQLKALSESFIEGKSKLLNVICCGKELIVKRNLWRIPHVSSLFLLL